MHKKSFIDIPQSLKDKRVLLRVDFNEPLEKGKIEDSFRIKNTKPTIDLLVKRGARVILVTHLEDSKKKFIPLGKVAHQFERALGKKLVLVKKYSKNAIDKAFWKGARMILLENIRFQKGEEKNDPVFSRKLASFADIYINEAFSVSHRAHASVVGVPRFLPSYAGPLLRREVERLSEALRPPHPFLLIVGGAKFDTKFALLKNFIPTADAIFLGGILANTFLVTYSVDIGKSLIERDAVEDIRKHFLKSKKIVLPFDVRIKKGEAGVKSVFKLAPEDMIHDIGPETVQKLVGVARLARLVVWNGPLGYTDGGYVGGTRELLRGLARLKTKIIIGGGDTLAVLDEMRLHRKFYHVSTGGGAMLDFLADGSLPGIDSLLKAQKRYKE